MRTGIHVQRGVSRPAATQRNCKRYNRGELVLVSVPARIHEALELRFTELFKPSMMPLKQLAVSKERRVCS